MNIASLVNAPRELEIDGVKYKVKDLDVDRLFQLSQWLQDRAFAAIARQPLDEPVKDRMRVLLAGQVAAGMYEPGGEIFLSGCLTPTGAAHALYLALLDETPDIDEAKVLAWVQAGLEEACKAAMESVGDPKASPHGASRRGAKSSRTSGTAKGGRSTKSKRSRRRK